ncbi:MAG: DUF4157 domain-containing protein [Acidobacteriota bacterium]
MEQLSFELRKQARSILGRDPGPLSVLEDGAAAAEGVLALARGGRIHVSPALTRLSPKRRRHVLGHELCHVVQQARGVVESENEGLNGCPVLELEAELWGECFADRRPLGDSLATDLALSEPRDQVTQHMVVLAGQYLSEPEQQLEEKTRNILALLGQADCWLEWAIGVKEQHFRYVDQLDLVNGIHRGLHGDSPVLLRKSGLLVSPQRLMELPEPSLDRLLAVEHCDGEHDEESVRLVLAEGGLCSVADLRLVDQFLSDRKLKAEPIFAHVSLADRLALLELERQGGACARNRQRWPEIVSFALEHACSAAEFADYYEFYTRVVDRSPSVKSKSARLEGAGELVSTLWQLVLPHLRCPVASRLPTTVELYAMLNQWVASNEVVGYARASQALRDLARGAGLVIGQAEQAVQSSVAFLAEAQRFLTRTEPGSRVVSQDGLHHVYRYQAKDAEAVVRVSGAGEVTLERFVPNEPPGAQVS